MIGIVILARLGSSRLPGKHLMKINGISVIEWLIKRIQVQLSDISNKKIIIATSVRPENQGFQFLQVDGEIEVFYGNDGNIPLRLQECARKFELDSLICFGGDNPLTSLEATKLVINQLNNKKRLIDYVETEGLPIGMNVFGFTRNCLDTNLTQEYLNKSDLEFSWNSVFKQNKDACLTIKLGDHDIKDSELRVTLDYQDDFEFFKKLFIIIGNELPNTDDQTLIKTMIEYKLYTINNHLTHQYWDRFDQGTKKTF